MKDIRKELLFYLSLFIVSSFLYTGIYFEYGFNFDFLFLIFIGTVLILIMFVDLLEMLIPDSLILPLIGLILIYHITAYLLDYSKLSISFYISGALLGGIIFLFILLISRGGIGEGDVILIGALGLIQGPYLTLLNILLSFLLGSLVSIFLLLTKIKSQKDPIPFGPFIIIAYFICLLYGDSIISWYLYSIIP